MATRAKAVLTALESFGIPTALRAKALVELEELKAERDLYEGYLRSVLTELSTRDEVSRELLATIERELRHRSAPEPK